MAAIFDSRRVRQAIGLFVSLSPLLVLLLVLSPAGPAQADNVVVGDGVHSSSCNMFTLGAVMNTHTEADITFACGGPATVVITQSGGLDVLHGHNFTIDGSDVITISGIDTYRLLNVQAGGALTLTHIVLAHGYATAGGPLPTQGGALLNNGGQLVLEHATVRDNQSNFAGGGVETAAGTTLLMDSLVENNQSDYGGGLDSIGTLTLIRTIVRNNTALTNNGGGLDVGGTVTISNSQIISNTADNGDGGGLYITSSGSVTIGDSLVVSNVATGTVTLGGGIDNQGALTLTQVTLSGNSAIGGGGIQNGGVVIMTDVSLNANQASGEGGGIDNTAALSLFNSTLSGNTATAGGAINNDGTATLIDVSLNANPAISEGGGINNSRAVTLTNVTLSGNTADGGGGINNSTPFGRVSVSNSTLSGNSALSDGGGIVNLGVSVFSDDTFYGNTAPKGGAIYQAGGAASLLNTIVAKSPAGGNCDAPFAGTGGATIISQGYNLSSDTSCQAYFNKAGDLPLATDPNLGPLANNGGPTFTHLPLTPDSPGIDVIPKFTNGCGTTLVTDQRGAPRPINGKCDIGAVEYGALFPVLWLPLARR